MRRFAYIIIVLLWLVYGECALAGKNSDIYAFSIPALSVQEALGRLAKQTGHQLLFSHELVESLKSNPVMGEYTIVNALDILLQGTGLSGTLTERGVILVTALKAQKKTGEDGIQMNSKKSFLAAVVGFLFSSGQAQADAGQEDVEKRLDQGKFQIEEVVVSATKRSERVQDIPIAISAYSGSMLEKTGVDGLMDLQKQSPSLQIGSDGHQLFITMRGIGAEVFNIGAEAGVTISQDGVAYGRNTLLDADFLDVERIEVLRGPQGTINGRNATGGAVNVYSKRPTEAFEARVKATAGNYNRFATEGYLSGPLISDKLLARIAFGVDNADGWLHNTLLNEDVENRDKFHLRASLLANPTDNMQALFILDGVRDKSARQSIYSDGRILPDVPAFTETAGVPQIDRDSLTFEGDQTTRSDKEQFSATLKLDWDLSTSAQLSAITGFVNYDLDRVYDCDGTRLSVCDLAQLDYDVQQLTQEVTLTADVTDRLDMILGGLYLKEDAGEPTHFVSGEYLGLVPGLLIATPYQDLTSYAVYTQWRYRLTDTLRISLGTRYTRDEKNYEEVPAPGSVSAAIGPAQGSWSAMTPRLAIDYAPTDDLTLFANMARGFKAGGFNTFGVPLNPFNPEYVWSYEGGVKAKLFAEQLRVAGSVFYMDYEDLQQNVFGLNGGFSPTILNAGQAEIKGLEFEAEAFIGDDFRFMVAGTWLDTEFTALRTADNISPELGEPDPTTGLNIRDLAGNRLPRAPEFQMNISGEYSKPLSNGLMGVLRVDYSWRSDVFFSIYNRDTVAQDAYGLLNLYVALESDDGRWSLSAFGRNVLDERYYINRSEQSAGLAPVPQVRSVFGTPRMYGVSLSYNF